MGKRKGTKEEVRAKAKAIAEDAKVALQETEHPTPTTPAAISDEPPIKYETRLVQPTHETVYPQVYDPEGNWVGFFISVTAANDWLKKRPKKGAGYVVNHKPPPRKERVRV